MSLPTKRLDTIDPTITPQRDHVFAAMRDGVSNRIRIEQILGLLISDDIPEEAVTLAKLAADARAAAGHTYDPTASGLTAPDVQAAIDELASEIAGIDPEIIQADTRQTVNTGPVNGDGRADFLAAGTGLEVVTTGLTTTPLNLTMGDGFGPRGKVDLSFEVETNLSWGSLPDATDPIYLYLEWDGSTLSTGQSTLAPIYSLTKPGSPATGQYWYPTDHRSRGERWDGSAWVSTFRVYVGQCVTSGGAVTEARSYAYQRKYRSENITGFAGSALLSRNTNLGVGPRNVNGRLKAFRSADGYVYDLGIYGGRGATDRRFMLNYIGEAIGLRAENSNFVLIGGTGFVGTVAWNTIELWFEAEGTF